MLRVRNSLLVLFVALVVVIAACGSSDDTSSADKSTTTLAPSVAAHRYEAPGPYPVGVTTLALASGPNVEVWYPAVKGSKGKDTYDVRALIPEAARRLLTANVPATYTVDATRNANVAAGEFPLVLFSHGASGLRVQSSYLTSHLASWGMIVAAPDHWSRDLFHALDRILGGPPVKANNSVDDLRQTRALLEEQDKTSGSRFEGHVDTKHIGAVGHSAGGGTVLAFASDPSVDGYVSLASGILPKNGTGSSTTAPGATSTTLPPEPVAMPDKPSFFMAGAMDHVAEVDRVTKPAYAAAPAPSLLWVMDGAGHNAFTDFCTFGNGTGIIGVAVASGLGPFLDAQPQFRRLGEDGCVKPAAPVKDTMPIVEHAVTAWLRHLFGVDAQPVGLGPEVSNEYAVKVVIAAKQ